MRNKLRTLQKFPCIRTVKGPDLDTGNIFPTHHSRVNRYPAIAIFLNTFIMGGATAGFAMIKLNTFIAPQVIDSRLGQAGNTHLPPRVIRPLGPDAMANRAGALG